MNSFHTAPELLELYPGIKGSKNVLIKLRNGEFITGYCKKNDDNITLAWYQTGRDRYKIPTAMCIGWCEILGHAVNYWEAHVTTDFITEKQRGVAAVLSKEYGFRIAKLYMSKTKKSDLDSFFTTRDATYEALANRVFGFVDNLKRNSLVVRQYKIEGAVLDVHCPLETEYKHV